MSVAGNILTNMNNTEWDAFLKTAYPMIQKQAAKLSTLDTDYYNNAVKNAKTVTNMNTQQRNDAQAAMGVSLTGQDAVGQNRADSLTATQAMNSSTNESVKDANDVKTNIANSIMGVQTTLKNQALSDASSASGMASSRAQQGYANKANQSAQNMQVAGTVASVAIMAF